MELSLLLDRLGYRNAVAEYAAEIFAKTGKVPLSGDLTYDAISRWAAPKGRIITVEPKRQKNAKRSSEEKEARSKGNTFRKDVADRLAEGHRKGKSEVELRERLKAARKRRNS